MNNACASANDHAPAARPLLRLVPTIAGLTPAERQAIEIGRDDAFRHGWDASLARPDWRRRLAAMLVRATGIEGVRPLADARLERLRLFAAMLRRADRRVHDLGESLRADGLSPAALHQAIALALA